MNTSHNLSEKDSFQGKSPFTASEIAAGTTILALLILIAFFGNLLTIIIFLRKLRLRTPTNISIAFLSASDITMAVLIMPFSLASLHSGKWSSTQAACTLNAYLLMALVGVSFNTMACTAVIRYCCVVKPSLHQYWKRTTTYITVLVMWLMPFVLIAIPVFVDSAEGRYQTKRLFCQLKYQYKTIRKQMNKLFIALVVLMAFTIFLAYYKVFRFVSHHNNTVTSNLQHGNHSHTEEAKVTRTLAIVVLGFVVSWISTGFIEIRNIPDRHSLFEVPNFVVFLETMLIFSSSAINPLIYGFTNRQFRKEFLAVFRCLLTRSRQIIPS